MKPSEIKKQIEEGCGRSSLWIEVGESFFRLCRDENMYDKSNNAIGKTEPKFCAVCEMERIPRLTAQLQGWQEALKEELKFLIELNKSREKKGNKGRTKSRKYMIKKRMEEIKKELGK